MDTYPVDFSVDYPDRTLNRLTSFFRLFTVIPIVIVLTAITGYSDTWESAQGTTITIAVSGIGLLFLPVLLLCSSGTSTPAGGSIGT